MADDNRLRSFRSNDPHRRAAEPQRPSEPTSASDPLAELARLIGQSDPFAELGRGNPRQPGPAAPAPQAQPAPPSQYRSQADYTQRDSYPPAASAYDDWRQTSTQQGYGHGSIHHGSLQHGSSQSASRSAHEDVGQDWAPEPSHQQHYAADYSSRDAHRQDAGFPLNFPPHGDSRDIYDDPRLAPDHQHGADEQYADEHHAEQQHADAQGQGGQTDQNYYQDDVPLEPHDDETYDDAPRARRRGGVATALALIGCAMLGTAGAYAYRSYVSSPGSSAPPPVITADTSTPTKIVPASAGDPQTSKAGQDRLANAGREQVISKQEEPVALRELGTQAAPRVVLPAPVQPGQGGSPNGSEPKKVRTVTIRPDGTDTSGRPVGAPPPAAQGTATTRTTPAAAPNAAAPGGRNAPISLEPQAPQAQDTAARTRTAATPPAARPAAETTSTSGFVVQLSSQKTEAEAQSSYRSLQAKFPDQLGNRQPLIRRADLGSKGVFYRTMVGPFSTAQEASQFCASYKAAGGQCVVPNN